MRCVTEILLTRLRSGIEVSRGDLCTGSREETDGCSCLTFALPLLVGSVAAQLVQITPLGLKTGELCFADRAMILEDPTGLRILYDPGVVVAGSADSRLGAIHVTLLSHVHLSSGFRAV